MLSSMNMMSLNDIKISLNAYNYQKWIFEYLNTHRWCICSDKYRKNLQCQIAKDCVFISINFLKNGNNFSLNITEFYEYRNISLGV